MKKGITLQIDKKILPIKVLSDDILEHKRMLVQMILYILERHIVFHYLYIYIVRIFFYHTYNCKIRFVFDHLSILDICKFVVLLHRLLCSSPAIYHHLSLQCVIPLLQMYTKLYNKAIKLFTYVFKLQASPIKRAHTQSSACLWI